MQSQFIKTGIINEETKYNHVVSYLSDDLTRKVIHILTKPTDSNKYTYFKSKLLALLQPTKAENATQLSNVDLAIVNQLNYWTCCDN